ncbi:MAG: NTP transferase domain-containing protein [Actinomycetota bacterium]|nr:NTP transferase domain-containing protein [Actinomycetota bacterium]
MKVWSIVVAAGRGERFGRAKQYEVVAGRRVLDWALEAARSVSDGVVVVVVDSRSHAAEPRGPADSPAGSSRDRLVGLACPFPPYPF